ncbi:MAG: ABC transporter permease [Candidatus Bathyanammoxibius sp.]
MQAYVIRRILLIIPTLLVVTVLVFLTIRLIPGSAIDQMLAGRALQEAETGASHEDAVAALRQKMGLDESIFQQYGRWVWAALQGDLGKSVWTGIPVMEQIRHRLSVSFELGVMGMVVALLIAFPIGIYSAVRQDTVGDYIARSLAIAFIALPGFWVATMVIVYPSIWWGWTPPLEFIPFTENPLDNLGQFIIPAFLLGMLMSGTTMRMTRTMMLEVLRQDYIRTAWSKGLRERTVVVRHALKNALIPVVTIIGMNVPVIVGGAVIIEQIFALPGIGKLMLEAIEKRDYALVSGLNMFVAFVILVVNLVVDLSYALLDPRIRYK